MKPTPQMEVWSGTFGREYTDRNAATIQQLDELYTRDFGIGRTAMNQQFVDGLPRDLRVLEVGSNIGNQLLLLQAMGFQRLNGVELQHYAVRLAAERTRGIRFAQGSAFDLPYRDRAVDLAFTSGVLIHLAPADLPTALREIHRTTRQYIWGMEYFSETSQEVRYRGEQGLLWKSDYCGRYLELFPDLRVVHRQRFPRQDGNQDEMFLLERVG